MLKCGNEKCAHSGLHGTGRWGLGSEGKGGGGLCCSHEVELEPLGLFCCPISGYLGAGDGGGRQGGGVGGGVGGGRFVSCTKVSERLFPSRTPLTLSSRVPATLLLSKSMTPFTGWTPLFSRCTLLLVQTF